MMLDSSRLCVTWCRTDFPFVFQVLEVMFNTEQSVINQQGTTRRQMRFWCVKEKTIDPKWQHCAKSP